MFSPAGQYSQLQIVQIPIILSWVLLPAGWGGDLSVEEGALAWKSGGWVSISGSPTAGVTLGRSLCKGLNVPIRE